MNNKVEYTSKFQYEASPISYGKDENGLKIFKPKYSDDGKILIVLNGKERELDELVPFRWMSEVELTKEQAEKAIEGTVGFEVVWAEHYEGKMNFGSAIEALKLGALVARKGWNGKGMFVCKQVPAIIDSTIIPKMQSLPDDAKTELLKKNMEPIEYRNQMLIVNTSGDGNKIADSWVPSSSDLFAEDWIIIE